MKAEVAIVNGNADQVYQTGEVNNIFAEFTKHVTEEWHTDKDQNGKPKAIRGDPQYVAIHVNKTDSFRVIMEIDYQKSKLSEGKIVPKGKPIPVYIPIKKFSKDALQGIRYTTFRTLITHESTAEFKNFAMK